MTTENDLAFCQMPDSVGEARSRLERLLASGHNIVLTTANLASCAVLARDAMEARKHLTALAAMDLDQEPGMWLWLDIASSSPRIVQVDPTDLLAHLEREITAIE